MNKRIILATGAGVAAFAAVTASAATLGGLDSTTLGADASVVASCDTDGITVTYTTAWSAGSYKVDGVVLGGVAPACATGDVKITLRGAGGSLTEVTDTKDANASQTVAVTDTVEAEDVTGVAVVIVVP